MIIKTTIRKRRTIVHFKGFRMVLEGLAPSHDIAGYITLAERQRRDIKVENDAEMMYVTPSEAVRLLRIYPGISY